MNLSSAFFVLSGAALLACSGGERSRYEQIKLIAERTNDLWQQTCVSKNLCVPDSCPEIPPLIGGGGPSCLDAMTDEQFAHIKWSWECVEAEAEAGLSCAERCVDTCEFPDCSKAFMIMLPVPEECLPPVE